MSFNQIRTDLKNTSSQTSLRLTTKAKPKWHTLGSPLKLPDGSASIHPAFVLSAAPGTKKTALIVSGKRNTALAGHFLRSFLDIGAVRSRQAHFQPRDPCPRTNYSADTKWSGSLQSPDRKEGSGALWPVSLSTQGTRIDLESRCFVWQRLHSIRTSGSRDNVKLCFHTKSTIVSTSGPCQQKLLICTV